MTQINITLYSDSAKQFNELKEKIAERRGGIEPSNAELVRILMGQFEPSGRYV